MNTSLRVRYIQNARRKFDKLVIRVFRKVFLRYADRHLTEASTDGIINSETLHTLDAQMKGDLFPNRGYLKTEIKESKYDEYVTAKAFEVLKDAMIADEPEVPGSYAHSWHCVCAMMCYDALRNHQHGSFILTNADAHKIGNDAASRFMKITFDVDTKG